MLDNPKRAFWEAFFLALVIFIFGIIIGIIFENNRLSQIDDYYSLSEVSLIDSLSLSNLADVKSFSCSELIKSDIVFADKIYEEARLLEKYEQSGDLTDSLKIAHKKYDVLRTLLWINVMKTKEKCRNNFSSIVYLYEYEPKDLIKRAQQIVWSRILFDLKQKYGDQIILIPISATNNVSSLDSIKSSLNISDYPVVVINEKNILYNLTSITDMEKYLK
jgi:hypothetical protein